VRCAARCPGVSGAASRSSTTNFRRRAWYAAQTRRPCAARAMSGAFARRTSRALWAAQRFHSQLRAPRAVPRPLAHLCNSRCVGCTRWARTACASGRPVASETSDLRKALPTAPRTSAAQPTSERASRPSQRARRQPDQQQARASTIPGSCGVSTTRRKGAAPSLRHLQAGVWLT